MEKNIDKQIELISRGSVEIIQSDELRKKLERAVKTNKPLVIKVGFDPTAPDIHLGHTVLLRKMRHFQQLGHKVVFLVGDATALVGDPSGRSVTRKVLTRDEVEANAKTYERQVGKILDVNDAATFQRRHNSEWFLLDPKRPDAKHPFSFEQFIELSQRYTVARLLERDDFQKRLKENKPISFLELFYPLMQGYDSVKLQSDVEIGGSDQKFNMLVGRNLQQAYSFEPQVVVTMPILEGLDGVQKMSKSLGNYIGINESAKEMFGKVMSISDALMYKYYELLTDENVGMIKESVKNGSLHPKTAKKNLAKLIVTQYHTKEDAIKQDEEFERSFKDKGFPQDLEVRELANISVPDGAAGPRILDVLVRVGLASSNGEAKRKIQEGAVEVDGVRVADGNSVVDFDKEIKIRVGKKFARAKIRK